MQLVAERLRDASHQNYAPGKKENHLNVRRNRLPGNWHGWIDLAALSGPDTLAKCIMLMDLSLGFKLTTRKVCTASRKRCERCRSPVTSERPCSSAPNATRQFREGLLKEGVECLLAGDVDTGKIVLRSYINATIGFEELGSLTNKPPKSLMRMFGPSGNPHARNLFEVISCIQRHEGVQLEVKAVRQAAGSG